MKDKKIFKKWWFWLIIAVIVLGAIGSLGQSDNDTQTNTPSDTQNTTNSGANAATLPKLAADEYKNEEGLVVYKELKAKGYKVDAAFDNQALTDINGKASDLFEPLDPNNADDKQSVDAFVVGDLSQAGDSVMPTITKLSN